EDLKKHLAVAPSTHIALKCLSKTETKDMVQGMFLAMHNPGEITEAVYGLSGGLPLLVEEAVGSMVGADILQRKRKRWHLKSEALKRVKPSEKSEWLLSGQLENVRPLEMEILQIASLLRGGFTREMLRDVVGISDDDAPSALMSLVSSGLIGEETGGRFAISNGYLASFIRDQMLEKRQRALHLKIGAVLERSQPAEAARHYMLGGDKEKAFKIGLKQARASEESGKNRDACELYEIALEAAPEPEDKFGILKELVRLHDTLADFKEALQAAQKAIRIGRDIEKPVDKLQVKAAVIHRKLGEQEKSRVILNQVMSETRDNRARCYALCELAWLHMEKNEHKKASDICEEARKIALANKDETGLARAYHNMGTVKWRERKLEAAERLIGKSVSLKLKLGQHASAAGSLNNLGAIYWSKGNMEEAGRAYNEALKEFEKAGDRAGIALAHRNLGLVAWALGEWELAAKSYENAYSIEEGIGNHEALARLDNMIGVAEEHLGNWKSALRHFNRLLRFSRSRGHKRGMASSLIGIGTLFFKMGDLTRALESFKKSLPLARTARNLEDEALCHVNLAMTKKELGDLDAAMDNINECITIFEREGMEKDLATAYRVKAEILLSQNEILAASKSARTAASLARRAEDRLELSQTYRVLGMMPGTSAKTREEYFQKSTKIAEDMKARYHLGKALLSYGQFLLNTEGRLAESLQQLRSATEIFEHLGAKRDLEAARKACANAISRIVDMRGFGAGVLQVSALNEIASLISSMTDISAVYQKVVDSVVNLLGAERGLLLLFSESGKRLEVAAENSMDKATTKDARTLSKGVIREAAGKGVAVICDDAAADPRFNRNRSVILNNIHSLLCVPLKLRQEIIGTIYVDSRVDKRLFSKDDIPFVNTLANIMAMAIDNARYHQEIRDENVHLRTEVRDKYSLGNIIGKSDVMQDVFNMISRVAGTDTTVLIEGETGTGKELVARAIHYGSRRADKRFLTIDCSALPDTLLESELFGHKRGSFTGAAYNKRGLFEAADGGTVFLDEIGDASPSVQSRLLRVLEQSEVRRVGESSYREVDVRILCATNKNLRREIGRGRFREDLYFRLNVLNIKLPPLKKRRQDIPLLANHFLRQAEKELGKRMTGITPAAVRLLMAHGWPGNVRELQHEIERACALVSPSKPITAHSLSPAVRGKEERREELDTLVGITQDLEKRIIEEALENLDWNRSWVAKELGLSRQGLLKKMRRHGLTGKETTQEV
ncbi:tetratricopeptide repeat protein, partial [candidate division TA06 bacterium]